MGFGFPSCSLAGCIGDTPGDQCPLQTHRSVPACVGNTSPLTTYTRTFSVHPRVCGEYGVRTPLADVSAVHPRVCGEYDSAPRPRGACSGSSPRVWGIRPGGFAAYGHRRFIPACVGNTPYGGFSKMLPPVHPRVCGEYVIQPGDALAGYGSSPRVWGILPPTPEPSVPARFIPACVGNTIKRVD